MCVFRRLRLVIAALYVSRYVTVRIYQHASALIRHMWDNTEMSTHPDMRRV